MAISSLNNVPVANILTLNGTSFSVIEDWGGAPIPPTPPPSVTFVTQSLLAYWDPNDAGSRAVYPFNTAFSCSLNLAPNYTSSVFNTNGSGSFQLVNGAYFRNFTSGSVNLTTYYFDGVNDYAVLRPIGNPAWAGDPNIVTNLKTFTIEMWLRSSGSWVGSGNFYSAAGNSGNRTRANDTAGVVWYYAPNVVSGGTGGTLTTNVWNHFVVTMADLGATNDRLRGYINGTQVFSDTTGNYNPNYNFSEWLVGTFFGNNEFQRMYVGEIRRYQKELTGAEVLTNFSSSATRYGRL